MAQDKKGGKKTPRKIRRKSDGPKRKTPREIKRKTPRSVRPKGTILA